MKILLIFFTVHLISAAVRDVYVTGYSGRSLLVNSRKTWHKNEAKSMEKLQSATIINNRKHNKWIKEGRFALFCNDNGNLMIYIKQLIIQDAGTYKISVQNKWSIKMTLNVEEGSCCNVSKRVTVNRGETGSFSCEYPHNHIDDKKIIFKEGKYSITMVYRSWHNEGRFSTSDNKQNNLFNVRITAVTPDDGGVYLCGVQRYSYYYRNSYSYYIINTVHLHIITRVGGSSVSGHSGAGLMIKCEHPQHKTKPKYICKESAGCSAVQEEWMKNGDVSVHDDTRAGVLMVFFRELKAADAGTYRCGVKESEHTESFTQLQIIIKHDAKYPEVLTESVDLGGEVNISCQIPEEQNVHFCKEDDHQGCRIMRASEATRMNPAEPVRVFTVSFSNVSVGDAGVYWCGAESRDTHLTFISLNTKIHLSLIMSPVVRREGESAEIICPYDSIYKSKSKSLCKGKCSTRDTNENERLTVKEDVTAGVFTGTITGLTAEDAGEYWCAVMLDRELNYLYTHLMVIIKQELNLTKYEGEHMSIQCKHHDGDQRLFCKAHEASMCVKDEAIRDDRLSFSAGASAGVFTVNITDLRAEDSGLYWCGTHVITEVNLRVKKDFSMILIISVCVVVLLIAGFTLTVCKSRHKRAGKILTSNKRVNNTTSSDSSRGPGSAVVISPDERASISSDDLLYAAVSFQKHEESLSEASVDFKTDELHCDYATLPKHIERKLAHCSYIHL